MAESGALVHELRAGFLEGVLSSYQSYLGSLLDIETIIRYEPGWDPSDSLSDVLNSGWMEDAARGFTGKGPHRADLDFRVEGVKAERVLSRGESKLFVFAVMLAQAAHLQEATGRTPVVLVDELASELDDERRQRVFSALSDMKTQTLVTAVSRDLVETPAWLPEKLFHVEQGSIQEVLQ